MNGRCEPCPFDEQHIKISCPVCVGSGIRNTFLAAGFWGERVPDKSDEQLAKPDAGKPRLSDAVQPSHYSRFKIQPIDFCSVNKIDFLAGNIIKYVCRYDAKNGLEDLEKAKTYLEKLIERTKEEMNK